MAKKGLIERTSASKHQSRISNYLKKKKDLKKIKNN